ncbi:cytochrome P450 87A3-like [Papaver somniferum]|uniref:cytochrome P450 87A3-like n=1 Tax=Papaver somniferum TaxID=3469 RepID=UPI000E703CE9|nr:cytochrome P450 87A3-like [Papaver somniferum]XP_026398385.1 cytochrome P450 87A3-like [Papaver somniferum]XP_026398387.1 cytochrome P450 87A3-like [Papaver somniferum]
MQSVVAKDVHRVAATRAYTVTIEEWYTKTCHKNNSRSDNEKQEEHEAIFRRKENVDASLTWKDFKSMAFTSQVLNETFRMANIAPGIPRRVIKDIHINGYVIPKGWTLMVVATAIHMNPKKFDDPHIFNPWRWNKI